MLVDEEERLKLGAPPVQLRAGGDPLGGSPRAGSGVAAPEQAQSSSSAQHRTANGTSWGCEQPFRLLERWRLEKSKFLFAFWM